MIKKLLLVVVMVIAGAVLLGCGGSDLPEGAVAKVGETVITEEALNQRMDEVVAQLKDQAPDEGTQPDEYKALQTKVLDYLVTLEISKQKAADLGVTVSEEDIQAEVDQIKQMFGGDDAKYQEALKGENLTEEQLRKNIQEQLLVKAVAEAAAKDVQVSDADIQAYYDANQDQFKQDESRTARHILFAPADNPDPAAQPTDADWEAALQEAEKVRKEILDGADFGAEAQKYSDDTGSAPQGGSLGDVQRGVMVPEFDEALFGLKKDDISQPIKTQFGYHLIQVQDVKEAGQLTLDDVKEQIKATLLDEKKTVAWQTWMDETRKALVVVIKPGMETTTSTTAAAGSDTSGDASTDTTASGGGSTDTTSAGATTTTAQ